MSGDQRSEGLFKHSTLLLAATLIGSFFNLLFHVVMGRLLEPAEYGVLAAMLGIVLIASMPMDAVRTALAHFAARFWQEGRPGAVKRLAWDWCRKIAWPALAIMALGIVFSGQIAAFFHIGSPVPVILTSVVLAGSLFMPLLLGALLGVQAFISMSVAQHSWGVVRLLVGLMLVYAISATATWGIVAQGLGVATTVVLGVLALKRIIRTDSDPAHVAVGVESYFVQSLFVLAGFAVLMNADVLLVKRFFEPEQAGLFARAGAIGRIMVFLTTPIGMALFPKVASAGAVDGRDWRNLLYAILYAAVLLAGAATVCSLVPWLPLWIIYGDRTPDATMIMLVRAMAWAMAPLGVIYVLLNFEIAQHRFGSVWALVGCAAGYVAGVAIFHRALWQIPAVLGVMSAMAVVLLIAGLPWKTRRNAT